MVLDGRLKLMHVTPQLVQCGKASDGATWFGKDQERLDFQLHLRRLNGKFLGEGQQHSPSPMTHAFSCDISARPRPWIAATPLARGYATAIPHPSQHRKTKCAQLAPHGLLHGGLTEPLAKTTLRTLLLIQANLTFSHKLNSYLYLDITLFK